MADWKKTCSLPYSELCDGVQDVSQIFVRVGGGGDENGDEKETVLYKMPVGSAAALTFVRRNLPGRYSDLKCLFDEDADAATADEWRIVTLGKQPAGWSQDSPKCCASNREDGRVRYDKEKRTVYMVVASLPPDYVSPEPFPVNVLLKCDTFDVPQLTWEETRELMDTHDVEDFEPEMYEVHGQTHWQKGFDFLRSMKLTAADVPWCPLDKLKMVLVGTDIDRSSSRPAPDWLLNDPTDPAWKNVGVMRCRNGDVCLVSSVLGSALVNNREEIIVVRQNFEPAM